MIVLKSLLKCPAKVENSGLDGCSGNLTQRRGSGDNGRLMISKLDIYKYRYIHEYISISDYLCHFFLPLLQLVKKT